MQFIFRLMRMFFIVDLLAPKENQRFYMPHGEMKRSIMELCVCE